MTKAKRRKFSAEFKSKVTLEALKEQQTIESLSKKHDVHPHQINTWKREFIEHSPSVFEKNGAASLNRQNQEDFIQILYAQIGELKVSNDFLKKNCYEICDRKTFHGRNCT
jgi:transposase-like protein